MCCPALTSITTRPTSTRPQCLAEGLHESGWLSISTAEMTRESPRNTADATDVRVIRAKWPPSPHTSPPTADQPGAAAWDARL